MDAIHLSKDGVVSGPFTREEVEVLLGKGDFSTVDYYWREGMEAWQPVAKLGIKSVPAIEPKRTLPAAVAVIARLSIIMRIEAILGLAVFPFFTWIPGYPWVHGASVLPLIHPFIPVPWMQGLQDGIKTVLVMACCLAMLRGRNWGRLGFVALKAYSLAVFFPPVFHKIDLASGLMHLAILLLPAVLLFLPSANRFFVASGPVEKPGYYGYGCLFCFDITWKLLVFFFAVLAIGQSRALSIMPLFLGVILPCVLALAVLYLGLFLNRFRAWEQTVAVIFLLALLISLPMALRAKKRPHPPAIPAPAHSFTGG